jgi:hypothetical protein
MKRSLSSGINGMHKLNIRIDPDGIIAEYNMPLPFTPLHYSKNLAYSLIPPN